MCFQLYLHKQIQQKYINDLTSIKNLFIEKIQPIVSDPESEAEKYRSELWESICNPSCAENRDIDPSDYVDFVEEQSCEKYEFLRLVQYRNIAMWISCLCQIWEQQLISFIIHEAQLNNVTYDLHKLNKQFKFIINTYKNHGIDFQTFPVWTKIKELRLLVNVIKHSEGFSEQKLRKIRPDYFVQEISGTEYDCMSLYHTSLLEPTLIIDEKDFIDYFDALVQFWQILYDKINSE